LASPARRPKSLLGLTSTPSLAEPPVDGLPAKPAIIARRLVLNAHAL
jgi:hypothetical protein